MDDASSELNCVLNEIASLHSFVRNTGDKYKSNPNPLNGVTKSELVADFLTLETKLQHILQQHKYKNSAPTDKPAPPPRHPTPTLNQNNSPNHLPPGEQTKRSQTPPPNFLITPAQSNTMRVRGSTTMVRQGLPSFTDPIKRTNRRSMEFQSSPNSQNPQQPIPGIPTRNIRDAAPPRKEQNPPMHTLEPSHSVHPLISPRDRYSISLNNLLAEKPPPAARKPPPPSKNSSDNVDDSSEKDSKKSLKSTSSHFQVLAAMQRLEVSKQRKKSLQTPESASVLLPSHSFSHNLDIKSKPHIGPPSSHASTIRLHENRDSISAPLYLRSKRGAKDSLTIRKVLDDPVAKTNNPDWERLCIIEEIIATEAEFNFNLNVVKRLFVNPLFSILSPTQMAEIFGNIEAVLNASDSCLDAFKHINLLSGVHDEQMIGKIFLEKVDVLCVYQEYCLHLTASDEAIKYLKKKNQKFANVLFDAEHHPDCKKLDISSFLSQPFQRITRYPLLLTRLQHLTPQTHPDYTNISNAIKQIESLVGTTNDQKKIAENECKITEMKKFMVWNPTDDDLEYTFENNPERLWIYEGDCKIAYDKKYKKNHLILFNDVLIVVKKKDKKLVVKSCFPIQKCLLWEDEGRKKMDDTLTLLQTDKQKKLVIRLPSEIEKKMWADRITECIGQYIF